MIGRYVFSIVVGVIVTLSLLFVMQLLIVTGKQALTTPRDRAQLDFVRVRPNESLNVDEFTPEKPPPPPEVPPEAPPQNLDSVDPNAPTINVAPPQVAAETNIGGPGAMNIAEGDYLPIVACGTGLSGARTVPRPRGLRGSRVHRDDHGYGQDPVVIFSTSSLFERAATTAVLKFKYKPRVVDGVPVDVPGVKTRITFRLED